MNPWTMTRTNHERKDTMNDGQIKCDKCEDQRDRALSAELLCKHYRDQAKAARSRQRELESRLSEEDSRVADLRAMLDDARRLAERNAKWAVMAQHEAAEAKQLQGKAETRELDLSDRIRALESTLETIEIEGDAKGAIRDLTLRVVSAEADMLRDRTAKWELEKALEDQGEAFEAERGKWEEQIRELKADLEHAKCKVSEIRHYWTRESKARRIAGHAWKDGNFKALSEALEVEPPEGIMDVQGALSEALDEAARLRAELDEAKAVIGKADQERVDLGLNVQALEAKNSELEHRLCVALTKAESQREQVAELQGLNLALSNQALLSEKRITTLEAQLLALEKPDSYGVEGEWEPINGAWFEGFRLRALELLDGVHLSDLVDHLESGCGYEPNAEIVKLRNRASVAEDALSSMEIRTRRLEEEKAALAEEIDTLRSVMEEQAESYEDEIRTLKGNEVELRADLSKAAELLKSAHATMKKQNAKLVEIDAALATQGEAKPTHAVSVSVDEGSGFKRDEVKITMLDKDGRVVNVTPYRPEDGLSGPLSHGSESDPMSGRVVSGDVPGDVFFIGDDQGDKPWDPSSFHFEVGLVRSVVDKLSDLVRAIENPDLGLIRAIHRSNVKCPGVHMPPWESEIGRVGKQAGERLAAISSVKWTVAVLSPILKSSDTGSEGSD